MTARALLAESAVGFQGDDTVDGRAVREALGVLSEGGDARADEGSARGRTP